jgi:hypothetical protein
LPVYVLAPVRTAVPATTKSGWLPPVSEMALDNVKAPPPVITICPPPLPSAMRLFKVLADAPV